MKNRILFLLILAGLSASAGARENAYDVLGKTLTPFVNVLSPKNTGHAISAEVSLVEMTAIRAEDAGMHVTFLLQNPDKLCLRANVMGAQAAVCRNGNQIWAAPGGTLGALLNMLPALPPAKSAGKLPEFVLNLPENQLVFMPALFKVTDSGDEQVNGESCRVLDVTLIPELAHSAGAHDWSARIWVRAGYQPAKFELLKPHWHMIITIDKLAFTGSLPDSAWEPSASQAADVLRLDATRFLQLLKFIGLGV